ncbi:flagellar basal-body MS-ring/collar protein FliF [Gracilinema caldarium]|uniref:Flagellar M-ring protein FliF n=1 Tax=Gracilinema caldarium (strain ATCC 51460 / DSM 7334 / H1) TaxID=744872 RepID=F8F1W6_GRAC1|nr:flagellar basal-body MS-ring/collar protein FliF [Gracilinema caldarium]AEJ19813.1 flagellar M-ring protein FliF [Gracilinema caldarium DSM 7334]
MNEWLQKFIEQIKTLWGKWTLVQKIILIGIVVAALVAVVVMVRVSATPTMVPIIDAPIKDENARDRIITRINEEGVKTTVSSTGVIMVSDEKTARRLRSILIREDLIPSGTDPWALFDRDRWTITDFERNVNLRRAITQMVTEHVKALDDVDDANVTIVMPERQLFQADQNPVTASVIITPRPGSDITTNRKKIEGIQKILKFAVEGLKDENIVITDQNGLVLNDFAGMQDLDRLELSKREQRLIQSLEVQYRASVLKALQQIYTPDRVRDLNIKIEMDMSKKAIQTEEFFPITIKPDNPDTPYDDSEVVKSITRSQSTSSTKWEGTGFNPEGPAGVEGQTPPAFKDMSNLYGRVEQQTLTQNEEINRRQIQEERSPTINRVTVSVNIDGRWKIKYNDKGEPVINKDNSIEREYIPIPDEELKKAQALVQDAIGFNRSRGDSVTVQNIQFDRTKQFAEEDAAFLRQRQFQVTMLLLLVGITVLLVSFLIFRIVSRELERRRRLREEELSRQHQMMRESALRQAEEEGVEVSMSVEERKRLELQENAINMAKEHPEDVAQLIRTWLLEE